MPILIDNANFVDIFGNPTTYYKANAGDEITATFRIRSQQRMTSIGNPLTLDPSVNQVQSPSISWLEEGFRPGQWVLIRIHSSGGGIINQFWSVLTYVDDTLADFTAMPDWYDLSINEFMTFFPVIANGSQTVIARDDMDVLFNNPKNSVTGSEFSLIDGDVTRFLLTGVAAMVPGDTVNATSIINQSGAFVKNVELEKVANAPDGWFQHDLNITFVNPGQYDDGSWFFSSECIKGYLKILWAMQAGEPYAKAVGVYDLEANTGGFNQAFNTLPINSSLNSVLSELDYTVPTTFDIVVDGPTVDLGLGASYRSINDAYFKNVAESQYNIAMLLKTSPVAVGVLTSEANNSGADYEIEINSVNTVGSVTTINVTFTPSANFTAFIGAAEEGDRLFYLWVKCGNVNWLVFNGQLTTEPPIGGPLTMEQDYGYLRHDQNITDITGDNTGFIADTEDDIAYLGKFLLEKGEQYQSFSAKIEAFNTVSEDDFTLQLVTFDFAGVPFSGDGRYLLNQTSATVTGLPGTSQKLNAILVLEPALDTPTHYGVKIYCPWLLNWRYWLSQSNASVDFYPNQNKNWEQYDNIGDWVIRTELTLLKDGLAFTHNNQLTIRDYDANGDIFSEIELIDDSTNAIVGVIAEGNLMRIRTRHTNLLRDWDPVTLWGMITIEPFESAPRWICSTVVPFDGNSNNPLTPLSGLLIVPVYPLPNIVEFECYVDTTKIDLSNGVSITSKVWDLDKEGCPGMVFENDECIHLENEDNLVIE